MPRAADRTGPSDELKELVARTRREQGLPPKVEDPAALARVADLLRLAPDDD
jgi:hypothetical protein